jgi:hypothetical protein
MHLLTTPLIYRLLSFKASPEKTRLIGIVLSIMFTVVMVTHMVMDEFLLHATTFGLGIYVIATRVLKIIPQQVKDPATKKKFQNIAVLGLGKKGHQTDLQDDTNTCSILWLWLYGLVNRRIRLSLSNQCKTRHWSPICFPTRTSRMVSPATSQYTSGES